LGAHEVVELVTHRIGERPDAGGVALQAVPAIHFRAHF
jgi:hypothetical protein